MEVATKEVATFTPIKKIISVKPILRVRNQLITDPEHEAFFLFGTATTDYRLPVDRNNTLLNPFESKAEQEWLEKQLDTDLNIYKKRDNFWVKHKVRLGKDVKRLNLENPKDYLDYLILKANKLYIAPDGDSQKKKATYRYALISDEYETQTAVKSSDKKKIAWKAAAKLEEKGKNEMINFLKVYGNRVSPESKIEFLIGSIDKIIEEDIDGFLKIVEEKDYDLKLLISNAVDVAAIIKKGRAYFLPGGDALAAPGLISTIDNAVTYLKEPANSDIINSLKARINAGKK